MIIGKFLAGPPTSSLDATEEQYWRSQGSVGPTATGITVTPDLAFQTSVLFDGVRIIAEMMGSLSLILYRRKKIEGTKAEGKERAKNYPLYRTLRFKPNAWQTRQEWIEVMTAWAILWGQGLSEIIEPRGFAEALVPIDPDLVTVEQLPDTGRLRYRVAGRAQPLLQDEVFRLRGFGAHRFMGANVLRLAREAIALWLAMEKFGGLFFRQGASQRLLLSVPGKMSDTAYNQLKESVEQKVASIANTGRPLIATEGATWSHVGFNARESQMTEAREAQVYEVARWLNLPPHILGAKDAMANASAEQRARQLVDITLRPWCTRWEGAIQHDLIPEEDWEEIFGEFLLDSLLRGDTSERFTAYGIAIMNGIMSENEARVRENLDPWPGLDEPRRSVNQDRGGDPDGPRQEVPAPAKPKGPDPDEEDLDDEDDVDAAVPAAVPALSAAAQAILPSRLRLIVEEAASRVVRKEITTLRAKAAKFAGDPTGWATWTEQFYAEHATLTAETLQLAPRVVRDFIGRRRAALLAEGVAITERWELETPGELAALAMEV